MNNMRELIYDGAERFYVLMMFLRCKYVEGVANGKSGGIIIQLNK